ncbi:hypothetical protein L0128_03960 [candidate division KSB1 bacterium]|nr:hypothetical protein [candidate division KSB1 bacterium]
MDTHVNVFSESQRRTAMRLVIFAQCLGMIPGQVLDAGGLVILFSLSLNADPFLAVIAYNAVNFGAIVSVFTALLFQPPSPKGFMLRQWYRAGSLLMLTGMIAVIGHGPWLIWAVIGGLYWFQFFAGAGSTFWFPVLIDFVPEQQRGHFFGRLRAWWTVVSLPVVWWLSELIRRQPTSLQYAQIVVVLGLLYLLRNCFVRRFPELPDAVQQPNGKTKSIEIWRAFWRQPKARRFIGYTLIFNFWFGSFNPILILYLKRVLHLADNQNMLVAISGSIGAFLGFALFGIWVDRLGSRRIFRIAQGVIAGTLVLVALFSAQTPVLIYLLLIANIVIKGMLAAHGVASTAYLLYLMSGSSRALFSALQVSSAALMTFSSSTLSGSLAKYLPLYPVTLGASPISIFQIIFFITGLALALTLPALRLIDPGHSQLPQNRE